MRPEFGQHWAIFGPGKELGHGAGAFRAKSRYRDKAFINGVFFQG